MMRNTVRGQMRDDRQGQLTTWRALLGVCCMLWLGFAGFPAMAQPDAASGAGVDAVLIIDSSGSMKETDPRRLRVPAAKMFISLLSQQDRVGLISFSDNGYPVVRLTPATPANRDLLFKGVEKVSAKGAYTNLSAALDKGLEMLREEGDKKRRRMLVLMSDGKMDTGDWDNDQALLEKIRKQSLDALVKEGIEVYTIAFTEASDMSLMREMAERTAALSRMASNDRELHEVFSQIFESAKQPDMLPMQDGGFMVDSAVEEVTVVASKASADVEITVEMPDGRKMVAKNAGRAVRWFSSEQFDMITISKPPAGQWKLLYSDNRGDRAYVVTNLSLDARIGEAPVYSNAEQQSEAWLSENGEIITKPEILKQTTLGLEITQPDGVVLEIPLADAGMTGDRAAGDGVFSNVLAFVQPGQHRVRVVARGETFQREKALFVEVVEPTVDTTQPPMEPASTTEPEPVPEPEPTPEPTPEPAPESEPEPAPEEKGVNLGLIVSLFVLFNLLVAAGIGGFMFWRKRKAAKAAASEEADEDDTEK